MKKAHVLTLVGLVTFLLACGDNGNDGGSRPTLRGRLPSGQALTLSQGLSVDVNRADAIWAVAVGPLRTALTQRIVLPINPDGSFAFTPEQDGTDYILALVDTTACTNATARKDWIHSDIDARLGCILGYVSIPDAETSGSMVAIPTSTMTSDTNVGEVSGGEQDDEATSTNTLQGVAQSFSVGLEGLRDISRVDNTLKALAWAYANMSDDGSGWYELNPNYTFSAPDSLEAMADAPSDPWGFLPLNWGLYWGTSVDVDGLANNFSTPGYLNLVVPHGVDHAQGAYHYAPRAPIGNDHLVGFREGANFVGFLDGELVAAAEGTWEVHRDGNIVSKQNMSVSSPFDSVDGVLDLSHITSYVPVVELETTDGSELSAVKVTLKTWDGTGYADANERLAFNHFEIFGATLSGDGSPTCPTDGEWTSNWDVVADDVLVWQPPGAWLIGEGSAVHCGLESIAVSYRLFGADYAFSWQATREPFSIRQLSGPSLSLDPDNAIDGTYVGFQIVRDIDAVAWRDSDLWVQISDIVTTPTAGLVGLGAGEDGVFHLGRLGAEAWIYLEYTGSGSPPANFETAAILTLRDGRPGREKHSLTFPLSWSNLAAPAEDSGLSVAGYEQLPDVSVGHGGQREILVKGTITGLSQGDHFTFSAASAAGWPADEYELVATRSLILAPGTLDLATPPCLDPACEQSWYNPSPFGVSFYAAEAGDIDYQVQYLLRWTGAGSQPQLSAQVFASSGATAVHAPASDNAAAPALVPTIPSSQMFLTVTPSLANLGDAPLRVEYLATITHATVDGCFPDRVSIALPAGARVIPRTSRWRVATADENLAEPTFDGTTYEWPAATFIPVGSDGVVRFEAMLAPTAGEHTATGQAWIGKEPVDLTATLGDSAPAFATVTVSP